jgi:thiosulfate reductase cytochrome b subunit
MKIPGKTRELTWWGVLRALLTLAILLGLAMWWHASQAR